ncbi:MAG: hypothetical protein V4622_11535 [Bacteroidota bacterium]
MKITLILTLLLFGINVFSQKSKEKKPNATWEYYLNLSKENCPEAFYILSNVKAGEFYSSYGLSSTQNELERVRRLEMVVHEACHGLNDDISDKVKFTYGYFIEPGKIINVPIQKVYNSYELNKVIPDSIQEKIHRYETYIGEKQLFLGAQKYGIYGLLDEFCAYYNGALCQFEMRSWYEKQYGYKVPEPWVSYYIQNIGTHVAAFYDFRLFMAWYLDYAKKEHPEDYKIISEDVKLKETFALLYNRFEKLAQNYEKEVYSIEKILNENGSKVRVDKNFFQTTHTDKPTYGSGHFLGQIAWLKTLSKNEVQDMLNLFMN